VDKFSKWIEAVPVTNQEATTAVKFFESIVYRYGVPNSIITDNGTSTLRWRTPSLMARSKKPTDLYAEA
jgi:hypothetical protein